MFWECFKSMEFAHDKKKKKKKKILWLQIENLFPLLIISGRILLFCTNLFPRFSSVVAILY